jgi:hypothetical protein
MLLNHMRSNEDSIPREIQIEFEICMDGLKELAQLWLTASIIHTLVGAISSKNSSNELSVTAQKKQNWDQNEAQDEERERRNKLEQYCEMIDMSPSSTGASTPQASYGEYHHYVSAPMMSDQFPQNHLAHSSDVDPYILMQEDKPINDDSSPNGTYLPTKSIHFTSDPATISEFYLLSRPTSPTFDNLYQISDQESRYSEGSSQILELPSMSMDQSFGYTPESSEPKLNARIVEMAEDLENWYDSYSTQYSWHLISELIASQASLF